MPRNLCAEEAKAREAEATLMPEETWTNQWNRVLASSQVRYRLDTLGVTARGHKGPRQVEVARDPENNPVTFDAEEMRRFLALFDHKGKGDVPNLKDLIAMPDGSQQMDCFRRVMVRGDKNLVRYVNDVINTFNTVQEERPSVAEFRQMYEAIPVTHLEMPQSYAKASDATIRSGPSNNLTVTAGAAESGFAPRVDLGFSLEREPTVGTGVFVQDNNSWLCDCDDSNLYMQY